MQQKETHVIVLGTIIMNSKVGYVVINLEQIPCFYDLEESPRNRHCRQSIVP